MPRPFSPSLPLSKTIWLEGLALLFITPVLIFPGVFPLLTAVSLSLLALILLLPILMHHRPILPVTPINILVLLWLIGVGVSVLVTADPDKTLPQFTRFIASLILFYGLVTIMRRRSQLTWLAYSLMGLGALFALAAPVAVAWNETKSALIPDAVYQLFPLLSPETIHPNTMASLMILLLPLPLAYLAQAFSQRNRLGWLWLVMTGWMGFVLLLTKSRGGYLAAVIGVLLVFWLMRRRWLAVGLAGITAVTAAWLLTTASRSDTAVNGLADPGTMAFRLGVWRIALWMMSDFSFTGAGMGAFNDVGMRLYPFAENNNPGAHNIYLQMGVDLGIPGLITYLAWLLLALFMAWKTLKWAEKLADNNLRTMMVGVLAGLIAYSAHGLVDNGLLWTLVSFVPWLVVALIASAHMITRQTAVITPMRQPAPTPDPTHSAPDPNVS
jgi:putative inorganic carbon (hco3(-)) transporter